MFDLSVQVLLTTLLLFANPWLERTFPDRQAIWQRPAGRAVCSTLAAPGCRAAESERAAILRLHCPWCTQKTELPRLAAPGPAWLPSDPQFGILVVLGRGGRRRRRTFIRFDLLVVLFLLALAGMVVALIW